jgi:hypothetical protein
MILDTTRIRLLKERRKHVRKKACINVPMAPHNPYLVVFQAEIGDATHGSCLALGKVLVHLVDAFRNVVVRLVE